MIGGSQLRCQSCGTDLWDVERYVRAGGVVACGRCLRTMSDALAATDAQGPIDVVVPPRLHGEAPDAAAVAAVTAALFAVFGGGSPEERAVAVENPETLGPLIEQVTQQYLSLDPRLVVDRVRFPDADTAEVRFRFVLHGGPGGIDASGRVLRRDGRWVVTRETVINTLPGGGGRMMAGGFPPVGGVGFNRIALWAQSQEATHDDDDDDPPDGPVPAPV